MTPTAAAALAQKLIAKNGSLIKVQRLSGTAADPLKPWNGAGTPTVAQEVQVSAVMLPHTGSIDLGMFGVDTELLKRIEEVFLIPGQGATNLESFNQLEVGSVVWKVDWIRGLRFAPLDVAVLYVFGVCR